MSKSILHDTREGVKSKHTFASSLAYACFAISPQVSGSNLDFSIPSLVGPMLLLYTDVPPDWAARRTMRCSQDRIGAYSRI